MSAVETKGSFFRQSGWLMIATVGAGVFMTLVHTVASRMDPAEYGVFFTLLRCLILTSIPAAGLQTIFVHQAAAAITEQQARELAYTTRAVLGGIFGIWLLFALGLLIWQRPILAALKITNPAALWLTFVVVLTSLWLPMLRGLLQGVQNFLGLGWVAIFDGIGRFVAVGVIVLALGGQAAGGMTGALLGQLGAIGIGLWMLRAVVTGPGAPIAWRRWLRQVIPLTLGAGAALFLSTADVIYIQTIFPKEVSPFYMPGAMIGFALVQFTIPLTMVMFPKIVRSAARAEPSDAMRLTLIATGTLGGLAALAATVLPWLPLRILYFKSPEFWAAAPLVPWFAWCMLALTLANVLISNQLARGQFRIVPWLVLVSVAYGVTLVLIKDHLLGLAEPFAAFKLVVQILTGFNLIAFALGSWFTWGAPAKGAAGSAEKPAPVAASS
jgi:O-antigen/teichoic acid export membrane protein